ncbi:MAG TPA: cbb3-type cytochrome c oxidase subunit 3 [Longimicrobiales bacterium]|nr:cbb3-type cytochrome c oxidase subunit 3 [Longimicrobiales bacterium]
MNPLKQAAAGAVSGGWVMGVMTLLFLLFFIGWTWWAFAERNRKAFEEAAQLPLTTGEDEA